MRSLAFVLALAFLVAAPVLADELSGAPTYSSGHFVLHCLPGSEAESDRVALFAARERRLKKLEAFFGRKLTGNVEVFCYPDERSVGGASPGIRQVYVNYDPGRWAYERNCPGHELTHLFTNTDERGHMVYDVALLDEGLAEYLSGWDVDPHLRLTDDCQAYDREPQPLDLRASLMMYRSRDLYQTGGSFVKFLVETQPAGRLKMLRLLAETRLPSRDAKPSFEAFKAALQTVYAKSYDRLMEEWNKALVPCWGRSLALSAEDQVRLEHVAGSRVEQLRYLEFGHFLTLTAELADGRRVMLIATPEGSWKVVRTLSPVRPRWFQGQRTRGGLAMG